ncbi:MAG: hypothetical protein JWR07_5652, partial [Nevskia sp.]|nr:hypothetical protein [Nevskia sp.]
DIKGDLSGVSQMGAANPKLAERAQAVGMSNYAPQAYPVVFWDVFGEQGHPVRGTISDLGPLLLARLMGLSDVQEAVLQLVFKYCDDKGLLLLDFKDLTAALSFVSDNAKSLGADYGLVTKASVGAIQRSLLTLQQAGAEHFFGEPALDLPDSVLGQLGNRVQHALRAFTPRDQKAVKAAAETFRANPKLDVANVIQQLGVGEALVSTLGDGGVPSMVERTKVRPPRARIGAITPEERKQVMARSPVGAKYDQTVDRESAYEKLTQRAAQATAPAADGSAGSSPGQPAPAARAARPAPPSQTQVVLEAAAKSVVRSMGSQVGREIGRQLLRGLLGSLTKR